MTRTQDPQNATTTPTSQLPPESREQGLRFLDILKEEILSQGGRPTNANGGRCWWGFGGWSQSAGTYVVGSAPSTATLAVPVVGVSAVQSTTSCTVV